MKAYEASSTIAARPEAVWGVLTDGENFPTWDSGVDCVEEYTGPMLPVIWRSIPDLGPSFAQFASGLKQRVERGR